MLVALRLHAVRAAGRVAQRVGAGRGQVRIGGVLFFQKSAVARTVPRRGGHRGSHRRRVVRRRRWLDGRAGSGRLVPEHGRRRTVHDVHACQGRGRRVEAAIVEAATVLARVEHGRRRLSHAPWSRHARAVLLLVGVDDFALDVGRLGRRTAAAASRVPRRAQDWGVLALPLLLWRLRRGSRGAVILRVGRGALLVRIDGGPVHGFLVETLFLYPRLQSRWGSLPLLLITGLVSHAFGVSRRGRHQLAHL